jgi:hypothetical protein
MLSEEDKKDMLADAQSASRRESFRKLRALQSARRPSLTAYCAFCEGMAKLFPARKKI